jgi:hypothetical protein
LIINFLENNPTDHCLFYFFRNAKVKKIGGHKYFGLTVCKLGDCFVGMLFGRSYFSTREYAGLDLLQ